MTSSIPDLAEEVDLVIQERPAENGDDGLGVWTSAPQPRALLHEQDGLLMTISTYAFIPRQG